MMWYLHHVPLAGVSVGLCCRSSKLSFTPISNSFRRHKEHELHPQGYEQSVVAERAYGARVAARAQLPPQRWLPVQHTRAQPLQGILPAVGSYDDCRGLKGYRMLARGPADAAPRPRGCQRRVLIVWHAQACSRRHEANTTAAATAGSRGPALQLRESAGLQRALLRLTPVAAAATEDDRGSLHARILCRS